jgi:hypothetical protein
MKHLAMTHDIVVAGGGPGGIPAAIAAARNGAKTLLVEKNGYLGGNLSIGLPLLAYLDKWGHQVTAGIAQEYVDRLTKHGACWGHARCPMHNSITTYNHDISKIVLLEMCQEAGVEILLHAEVVDTNVDNGCLKSVTLYGKGFRIEVDAKVFIDATGDGDVAYMAGAQYDMGQKDTGVLQPPTCMFSVGGVNEEKFFQFLDDEPEQMILSDTIEVGQGYDVSHFRSTKNYTVVGLRKLFTELKAKGELPVDRDTFIGINSMLPGEHNINCTRHLGIDGSNLFDLTRAEIDGIFQIENLVATMRKHIPGYENCYITRIYPSIGIRETRRFIGKKQLTEDKILAGDIPEDAIGLGSYIIDIHDGNGAGTIVKKIDAYGIPYGCTVAKDMRGLMFAGRCASLDAVVMSSARVMPTCMVIGEGAGVGAALAVRHGIQPADVDVREIRTILKASGVLLDKTW